MNTDELVFIDEEPPKKCEKPFLCIHVRGMKKDIESPDEVSKVVEDLLLEKELESLEKVDEVSAFMEENDLPKSELCLIKDIIKNKNPKALVTFIKKYMPEDDEIDIISMLEEDIDYEPEEFKVNSDKIVAQRLFEKMTELNFEAFQIIDKCVLDEETTEFDEISRIELFSNPKKLIFLQLDVERGIFQKVMQKLKKVKDNEKYKDMNTLELYNLLKSKLRKKPKIKDDNIMETKQPKKPTKTVNNPKANTKTSRTLSPREQYVRLSDDEKLDVLVKSAYEEYLKNPHGFMNKFR